MYLDLLYTSNFNSCSQSHSDTQSNRAAFKFKSQDSPVHTVHCEAEVFEGCLAVLCVARVACIALLACVTHDGFSFALLAKPAGSKLLCSAACRCFGCGMHVYGELLSELRVCSELLSGMLGRSLNCEVNGIQQRFVLVITLPYICG